MKKILVILTLFTTVLSGSACSSANIGGSACSSANNGFMDEAERQASLVNIPL